MTIVHVRMDYRLIHGQVLVSWNTSFKCNRIIVANDAVAKDNLQITLLKSVAPIGSNVSVLSTTDCVAYCNSPEGQAERIFVIVKYPEDGLALLEKGLEIKALNLGNQAFMRGAQKLSKSVYLLEPGVRALKVLHEKGVTITCRMMPNEPDNEYWPTIEKTFPEWIK